MTRERLHPLYHLVEHRARFCDASAQLLLMVFVEFRLGLLFCQLVRHAAGVLEDISVLTCRKSSNFRPSRACASASSSAPAIRRNRDTARRSDSESRVRLSSGNSWRPSRRSSVCAPRPMRSDPCSAWSASGRPATNSAAVSRELPSEACSGRCRRSRATRPPSDRSPGWWHRFRGP